MTLEVSEERKGGALILGLSGKLDALTSKTLEDKILEVIDLGERQLVVDCSLQMPSVAQDCELWSSFD